jgi:hypothetical protein
VLYTLGLIFAVASIYAAYSGAIRLPNDAAAFYRAFGTLNFVGVALTAILAPIAIVQFFRLRDSSPLFLTALFFVDLIQMIWYFPDLVKLGHGPAMQLVAVGIKGLIVYYSWHLRRVGVLR